MNSKLTPKERKYLGMVKELPCSVCDAPGPSQAHHIKQGQSYTCISLCPDCHTGTLGWHGMKTIWKIKKMDELDALNVTIKRLIQSMMG